MLVLTRKSGQKILIGKDIEITIIKVQGSDQVSIGIKAPKTLSIYREELIREVEEANVGGAINRKNIDVESLAKGFKLKQSKDLKLKQSKSKQSKDLKLKQ